MNNKIDDIILINYISGKIADEELIKKIENWINTSEDNHAYYKGLVAMWYASERDENDTKKLKEKIWSSIERKATGNNDKTTKIVRKTKWKQTLGIAASIAVLLSISIFFLLNQKNASNYHSFYTDAGSKSKITLSDGTTVYLNSETEIKIPNNFGINNRNVELIGEAYFEVKKTENKSLFNVEVGDLNIKVLGTEFNVKGYPGEGTIETTLENGKVEIEKQVKGKSHKIVSLKPNQQAVFVKKKGEILISDIEGEPRTESEEKNIEASKNKERQEKLILKERIETKLYTSWKEGKFIFESEKFDNLIVRMQRWYGITIVLTNDSLKNIEFTGTLKNETIEQALNALKMSQSFQYTMDIENNVIYIE